MLEQGRKINNSLDVCVSDIPCFCAHGPSPGQCRIKFGASNGAGAVVAIGGIGLALRSAAQAQMSIHGFVFFDQRCSVFNATVFYRDDQGRLARSIDAIEAILPDCSSNSQSAFDDCRLGYCRLIPIRTHNARAASFKPNHIALKPLSHTHARPPPSPP